MCDRLTITYLIQNLSSCFGLNKFFKIFLYKKWSEIPLVVTQSKINKKTNTPSV